ncbi:MAG: HesA/MoeB/ThiF family protein [Magnetococcales bacterium]|nr:HesA/MoeB/ThiF family protein [Magnetococcales bacterium]
MSDRAVLILGVGGLGSVVAMALGMAGMDRLTLVDADTVALSNLHRQPLYQEADVGSSKVAVAAERLRREHPGMVVETWTERVTTLERLVPLMLEHAITVDGSDNFTTRFLANDAALRTGRPLVHGAATGLRGQLMTILPHRSACLRCLFDAPPDGVVPTCQEAGVLGSLVREVGWLMAMEVVKWMHDADGLTTDRMVTIDLATGIRRHAAFPRQQDCRGCGIHLDH